MSKIAVYTTREPAVIDVGARRPAYTWLGERQPAVPGGDRVHRYDRAFLVELVIRHSPGHKRFEVSIHTAHQEYHDRDDGTEYVVVSRRIGVYRDGSDCDMYVKVDTWDVPRYNARQLAEGSQKYLEQLRTGVFDDQLREDALAELHRTVAA